MSYVEFGCGNKNMGMWAGKNKKRVGGLVSPVGMVKIHSLGVKLGLKKLEYSR